MIALACLLLFASSTTVELVDEEYEIPANQWRYVELGLKQRAAFLSADYQVRRGSKEVRLALLRREDVERLRNELPHGVLRKTEPGASGRLEYAVRLPGEYAVILDNRSEDQGATVHLRVSLDFAKPPAPDVTLLPRGRQWTVIAISFAAFFGIVSWSARRLLKAIKK